MLDSTGTVPGTQPPPQAGVTVPGTQPPHGAPGVGDTV